MEIDYVKIQNVLQLESTSIPEWMNSDDGANAVLISVNVWVALKLI